MKRIKSIRAKGDPRKPCNVAFREGLDAKREGLPESLAPTLAMTATRHICALIG